MSVLRSNGQVQIRLFRLAFRRGHNTNLRSGSEKAAVRKKRERAEERVSLLQAEVNTLRNSGASEPSNGAELVPSEHVSFDMAVIVTDAAAAIQREEEELLLLASDNAVVASECRAQAESIRREALEWTWEGELAAEHHDPRSAVQHFGRVAILSALDIMI